MLHTEQNKDEAKKSHERQNTANAESINELVSWEIQIGYMSK